MAVIKRNGRWTIDFRLDGKRYRKKSPISTRKGAQEYERLLLARLMRGEPLDQGEDAAADLGDRTTCETFFVDWVKTYAQNNNRPSEVASKESIVRLHLSPFFGKALVRDVGVQDVEHFKRAQREKQLSPKTVNNHLTVLRRALVSAEEWGVIAHVPTIKWLQTSKPRFDFLAFDEAERLLKGTAPEYHALVATALKAGLRRGELLALHWEDVDMTAGHIMVRRSMWKRKIGPTKTGRSRKVPMSATLARALRDLRHLRGPLVFCLEDGAPLTKDMIKRVLPTACRKAGLRTIQWHVLRHTFASHLVMKSVQLKAVQELLGHATIEATMIYAHLSESVHRDAIAKLDEPAPKLDGAGHSVVTAQG